LDSSLRKDEYMYGRSFSLGSGGVREEGGGRREEGGGRREEGGGRTEGGGRKERGGLKSFSKIFSIWE
jgi:hypothetical protein